MKTKKVILPKNLVKLENHNRTTRIQNVRMKQELFDKTIGIIANSIHAEAGNFNKYKLVVWID